MKIITLYLIGIICLQISAEMPSSGHAIQIINLSNHSLKIQLNEVQPILEADDIKDRHIVVVSIAGAFRQGKSFLLNFFIKYLDAQYKKHNVSDWLGQNTNSSALSGFKWRGGRKRETVGIWMWSEIFTHDFPNGDKVAIILLDTQGIFDDQSSLHDCTAIFALSIMSSSVQCYNLMQNIGEDHLQHLQLFTEYGRLALQQTHEKSFQKLLFIVRDWAFPYETPYGDAQNIIDEILNGNDQQTTEMRELRRQMAVNFEKIGAFLMPYPGPIVAYGQNFTGNLQQISPDFVKYLKELVLMLFAPENLIIKRINGQKVRARDLMQYLQAYTDMFNRGNLTQPQTILMATAVASNTILCDDSLQYYSDAMNNLIGDIEPYLKEDELVKLHERTKNEAVAKFIEKPKLGGDELRASFQHKVENGTEQRFLSFKDQNERKYKAFIEKAYLHNEGIVDEINGSVKRKIRQEIQNSNSELNYIQLNSVFQTSKQSALQEFDSKKMGDNEISKGGRDKIERVLDHLHRDLSEIMGAYNQCLRLYTDSMLKTLKAKEYFSQDEFLTLHHNSRNGAIQLFLTHYNENEFKSLIHQKVANIGRKIDFIRLLPGKRVMMKFQIKYITTSV
ncbi:atlastin-like [Sitodiplosis mosellana]|uniref:atlastin-like n=1 Tax=Sitodiplosis mosellana TaxID=263140 RepID=UPI002443DF3E|nr:atlastin-like [Sitodiplosis mosellana]